MVGSKPLHGVVRVLLGPPFVEKHKYRAQFELTTNINNKEEAILASYNFYYLGFCPSYGNVLDV